MRSRLYASLLAGSAFLGCKTDDVGSAVRDDGVETSEGGPTEAPAQSLEPVTSQIDVQPGEDPIALTFENHGSEYWLMNKVGEGTGYMAGSSGSYRPYGASCEDGDPLCESKPTEAARRCMKQSSDTLKEIEANPPAEWVAFKEKYGSLYFYGWVNDYNTMSKNTNVVRGRIWYGPFNWQGSGVTLGDPEYRPSGYIKWASAIYPDGTCKSPSVGLFLRLLRMMDQCAENPGPGCCGEALEHDANEC